MPEKKDKLKFLNIIFAIIAILVILILWFILYKAAGSEYIFPSVKSVIDKIASYLTTSFFWQSLLNTLLRVIIAFLSAFLIASALGIVNYMYPVFGKIIAPYIKIMISAPTVAIMIIFNMLMVKSSVAPILVAFTVIFPMTYSAVNAALSKIDLKLVEMAKIYKVPLLKRIKDLIIPSFLPYLMEQTGTIISFTLKIIVSAEIISNTYESIGGLLQQANVYIDIAGVMAMTVVSVIIAIILEFAIKLTVNLCKRRLRP